MDLRELGWEAVMLAMDEEDSKSTVDIKVR